MRESLNRTSHDPLICPAIRTETTSGVVCLRFHNEHNILSDIGKTVIGSIPREVCLRLFADALRIGGIDINRFNDPSSLFVSGIRMLYDDESRTSFRTRSG